MGEEVSTTPLAALPPGKTRYRLYRRPGGPQGPVWTGAENLAPTGIWSPDSPARSESLQKLFLVKSSYIATHHTVLTRHYSNTKN